MCASRALRPETHEHQPVLREELKTLWTTSRIGKGNHTGEIAVTAASMMGDSILKMGFQFEEMLFKQLPARPTQKKNQAE